MYYSNGNYEAFAHPEKPEGIEKKHAVVIGAGLAGLAAACFLVRDAQMPGENITIMEDMPMAGGACDGILNVDKGFIIRGGREMENHFECLWDLFRSIPSIENPEVSVLDEYYWLNKHDPNYSLCRVTEKRGQNAHTDGLFGLSDKACMEIMKLFFMKDEDLYGKAIKDIWTDEVFNSNFWWYWRTMFAFKDEHSALEVKKYIHRFIHHIGGLPELKALKFTKYNQYESMILPMIKYLRDHGVNFMFNTCGTNVIFDINHARKVATRIEYTEKGEPKAMDIDENTLVFFTNGSNCSNATIGDHHTAPGFDTSVGDSWKMWQNIARQDPSFGHPDEFLKDPELTQWESATLTTLDEEIIPYMQAICKRDPRSGMVVTGGIVTCRDSGWVMSWTVNRQPHFKVQPKNQVVVWIYGLYTSRIGDYVKKPMRDCTGEEIAREWLYHIGVPLDKIDRLAANSCNCVPVMMPRVTTYFICRNKGDRPDVVPAGVVNFAFMGNHAETFRDTVFTTEYSVRTAMEAVYTLCNVDRGVPEVFNSVYDVRVLLESTKKLMDGRKLTDMKLPLPKFITKPVIRAILKKVENTEIGTLLRRYDMVDFDL